MHLDCRSFLNNSENLESKEENINRFDYIKIKKQNIKNILCDRKRKQKRKKEKFKWLKDQLQRKYL